MAEAVCEKRKSKNKKVKVKKKTEEKEDDLSGNIHTILNISDPADTANKNKTIPEHTQATLNEVEETQTKPDSKSEFESDPRISETSETDQTPTESSEPAEASEITRNELITVDDISKQSSNGQLESKETIDQTEASDRNNDQTESKESKKGEIEDENNKMSVLTEPVQRDDEMDRTSVHVESERQGKEGLTKLQIGMGQKLYPDLSAQLIERSQQSKQASETSEMPDKPEVVGTAPQLALIDVQEISGKVTQQPQPRETIQTLTMEQLSSLYYNAQLESNGSFLENFVQREMKKESHEFYEILLNYQRSRKNLVQCELALKTLETRYESLQTEIWVTDTRTDTAKGVCGDNYNCSTTHTYNQARLSKPAMDDMRVVLEKIEDTVQNELSLYSYSAQLSRLQVESYIHNLFASSPVLRDIPRNLPVHATAYQRPESSHQVEKLKTCISILFSFHRLPIEDEEMVKNLQAWTERLVSACLRVCTFWDHLFILNHYMRCPAGIGSWAAAFVQAPTIPTNEDRSPLLFGNECLDHVITALATVLMSTSARTDFLCHMQKMFTPGPDQKTISWVMVDSDGEEDEDPQHAWMFLHENDIVAVLKQFPLAAIFRHIFFVVQSQFQDCYEYDIEKTSEAAMYRVFAFSTCLVRLLGNGLHTYNMGRYRQLNKRLGRMIRQSVQYVSNHWQNFRSFRQGTMSSESLQKLQAEFDAFFLRAVSTIHMSNRLGSCQFLADMPFGNVSMETMWKLLWLLHQGHGQQVDIATIPTAQQCQEFVKDPSSRSQLCDILIQVNMSDGVYLLNTMTNMTESCSSANLDFIETVTRTVFEVSYVCPETRGACSKMGRELLSAVVTCHPFIVSVLTRWVHDDMDKLGAMGVYLYSGLSLEAWLPSDPDIVIIRQWLLNSDLGSPENQLGQLILSKINWGLTHKGDRLTVPWGVHKQVSVLVVEAYQRFILGKNLGSAIMEGVKQLSAAVQQYCTSEQEFNTWCWDLLLKLALHRKCLPMDDMRLVEMQGPAPDLHEDNALLPLVKGTKEKNPAACFVAIVLSKIGHNVTDFLFEGMAMLEVLTAQGLYKPTICAIYYTLPMFADAHKHIMDSIRFQEVLLTILHADESYFKVVKGLLSYDFPGPITKLFTSMLQSQIHDARTTDQTKMVAIIEMWTIVILKVPKWHQDRNCCCVLDSLIESAFTYTPAIDVIIQVLNTHYKEFCALEKNQGMMSALVSWVTSGTTLPSFLDKPSCGEFSWLAYVLLTIEGCYESDTKLWETLHDELHSHPKSNVDQALKKATMKLKLEHAPVSSRLNIYRWAQQALDMPVEHPVAVLTWQRFFTLYLGRYVKNASIPQRASIGEKCFSSMGSMIKKMKKRLVKTADYYQKYTLDTNPDEEDCEVKTIAGRREFYCRLVRLFQTFQLWIEEPRLHDASLYLPSLPQQYQSDRLLQVFQNNIDPWLEYLDTQKVVGTVVAMAKEWRESSTPDQNPKAGQPRLKKDTRSPSEQILSRMSRCDEPIPPPPVQAVKAPVPELSPVIMEDKGAILHMLESDLKMLKDFASQFCSRMNQHVTKDHYYLDLIPKLYQNVRKDVTVSLKCTSMINPLHKCSKPGSAVIEIWEKWNDPVTQRNADENRAEFKQLLLENKLPPTQNVVTCAVHTENAITMLVKLSRSCTDEGRQKVLSNIACSLFFHFGSIVTDTIQKYPPTQQFFAACMDILGKEFIEREPSQVDDLLQMAIERPELGGLLSPHFMPLLSPDKFVGLYTRLVETLQRKTLELSFMLLTKFDVSKWLVEHNPSKQEVTVFVEKLGQALMTCGAEPDTEHHVVFGTYLGHEKIVLRHRFPLYLHQVIAAILQGSSVQKISVECWQVLQKYCFHGNANEGDRQETLAKYPQVFTNLSIDEIRNLLYWFGKEFMQIRQQHKETMTFGLYPNWQRYIPHIANFLRDLAKCLIDKMIPTLKDAPTNEALDALWRLLVESFAPWLQPLYNNKLPCMPWIAADTERAQCMVKAFTEVVGFAHYRTEELRGKFYHDFLSLTWLYFATVLCKSDVSPDVVAILNLEIATLPWQQLVPNVQVMETMSQMKEDGSPLGFNLVSDIVAEIQWDRVVTWYETCHPREVRTKFEGALFLLLIQAFGEHKHIENPDTERILMQAVTYKWQHMSPEMYRKGCSIFLLGSDPKCLLVERTAPETIGLRLMKSAAGFTTEVSQMWTEDWSIRRLSFLHTISSLICQCTYVTDWDQTLLSTVIINLLTEVETVESAVFDPYIQREESSDMAKEILSLLNNCKPDGEGTGFVMTGIMQWLQDSPQTILLSPFIFAATRNLASVTYMTQIVEQCIELAFIPGSGKQQTDPWPSVLAALQIPELSLTDFILTSLTESSFLLLYSYVLQRAPLCQDLTEEQGLIEMILDWTEKAKPSPDNESKLLLWWHKVIALIIRQLDYGRDVGTCVYLMKKFQHKIQSYGEDRASGGLLGAIGLGKRSALSERFRVCSRAIVAFISRQVVSDHKLRLDSSEPTSTMSAAKQDLSNLLSLRNNKKYQPIKTEVEDISDFVKDQSKCLKDIMELMSKLRTCFYAQKHYLSVIDLSENSQ